MRKNNKAIYFDMDGTLANLYGVMNWLPMLIAHDATPYAIARPLLRLATLARILNRLQRQGYTIGIVSWLAKGSDTDYDNKVAQTKIEWLQKHMASVQFDEIHITEYGTPKNTVVKYPNGILFDDEEQNRTQWTGKAYDADDIIGVLKAIA